MAPKMTIPTQLVLHAMLEHPDQPAYGLQLIQATGFPSGTIHPILARLEAAGWLTSTQEDGDPRKLERPRRRYYQLTPDGIEQARQALANAHTPIDRITGRRAEQNQETN